MSSPETIPLQDLDVYTPFKIIGMGSAQGEIETTLEDVVATLLQNGADPEVANVERLEASIGRSVLPRISSKQSFYSLGTEAASVAIEVAGIDPKTIDGVICASSTAPRPVPDASKYFHAVLGIGEQAFSKTETDACQAGVDIFFEGADAVARRPGVKRFLGIAVDVLSTRLNPKDPSTNAIFSDLATAFILETDESASAGVVLDATVTDSSYLNALTLGADPNPKDIEDMMYMDARDVGGSIAKLSRMAVQRAMTFGHPHLADLNDNIGSFADMIKADLTGLPVVASHQPSKQMAQGIDKRLFIAGKIPEGTASYFFDLFGNGSAPTALRALQHVIFGEGTQIGHLIHPGDRQFFEGTDVGVFGAGVGATARFGVIRL